MIFAQLTDTHIKPKGCFAYGHVDTLGFLRKAIEHLNAFQPALDFVVISGDLVDVGTQVEYTLFREAVDQLRMPYYVIPGNHDHKEVMRTAFADHTYLTTQGPLQFSIEQQGLRIIGLDTSQIGKSEGAFPEEQQDWLTTELAAHPDQPTMIFMHHPPFKTGIQHMDDMRLLDADQNFWRLLKGQSQIIHIACGHVHRAIETFMHGIPISISPSSAHAVTLDLEPEGPATFTMDPQGSRIFIWNGTHLVSHLTFFGDYTGPHPFFGPDGKLLL